ncbi:MAG: hypothetical protein ACK5LS_10050 [Propioniciclava sp.]
MPPRVFPTFTALNALALGVGLAAGLSLAGLAWKLADRSPALAVALAATPAGIDMLVSIRRPDILGCSLLVVTGACLLRWNCWPSSSRSPGLALP